MRSTCQVGAAEPHHRSAVVLVRQLRQIAQRLDEVAVHEAALAVSRVGEVRAAVPAGHKLARRHGRGVVAGVHEAIALDDPRLAADVLLAHAHQARVRGVGGDGRVRLDQVREEVLRRVRLPGAHRAHPTARAFAALSGRGLVRAGEQLGSEGAQGVGERGRLIGGEGVLHHAARRESTPAPSARRVGLVGWGG